MQSYSKQLDKDHLLVNIKTQRIFIILITGKRTQFKHPKRNHQVEIANWINTCRRIVISVVSYCDS